MASQDARPDRSPTLGDEEKMTSSGQAQGGMLKDGTSNGTDVQTAHGTEIMGGDDVLGLQDLDPALNMKMHLVNDAIDEIGWTPYHTKLFFLNGFGYAVDSLILLFQSIISSQAYREFGEKGFENGLTIAVYVGMLTGAIVVGFSADIIGRKYAFNISLLVCSVSCILAGAMPNWASLGVFVALLGAGGGGNLVMDTTVFLEYLPGKKQWMLTFLAAWWGVGQAIAGFIAWGFMVPEKWNCPDVEGCTWSNNWGWRYVMFTGGALVLVMSLLRVTVVRLRETPKYQLGMGQDAELIETLHILSTKYNRPCSLTLERLQACGEIRGLHDKKGFQFSQAMVHFRGLFATRTIAISTSMIWASWTLIGLAYPLWNVFLPVYLQNSGASFNRSQFETWRNYALTNTSSIPGPMVAGFLCNTKLLGRKYTMVIGALLTVVFLFAYTQIKTKDQDVAFSCTVSFCLNIYYGTLYAYTPEVLPSAHRGTGNGISVACNRIMGIMSAIIATYADTSTPAPLWICGALFIGLAGISALFPFEPYGRRSS